MTANSWPELSYQEWLPTYQTLHRWIQVVGKLRLCKTPWINHSWHSTLYVTPRGLSTHSIPLGEDILSIEFDFHRHELRFQDSLGESYAMPLRSESVASFYERFQRALDLFSIEADFYEAPNELEDCIPFRKDSLHHTYVPEHAFKCWQVLIRVHNLLEEFRSGFIGKVSPVHFFWGAFDLAVTRFSGRTAPEHPGGIPHLPDRITREAYSQEVASCGFWPGNEVYPHAAFYSYAYPTPTGFENSLVEPEEAFWHPELKEFILPYEKVRWADDPHRMVQRFLQSSYENAAELARWDRGHLESTSAFPGDEAIRQ